MAHKLGMSGSTILSDEAKFDELFRTETDHIEIGEFASEHAFRQFLEKNLNEKSYGIHSPLYRSNSKYDLLEYVQMEPEQAWEQIEQEAEKLSRLGAEYMLVHFPYFKGEVGENGNAQIEAGLQRLSNLQKETNLPIVCEPKLGKGANPAGISHLYNFPIDAWEKYGLHLCMDIGDYLIAVGDGIDQHIQKWNEFIKVVHLHNVVNDTGHYIWNMIHPSQEHDPSYYKVEEIIKQLATGKDKIFVFEHTPHTQPDEQTVREGIQWVRELIVSTS
ncbi:TIM barrel protein [Pontibacillus yanchengensis]|uniref:TIM barrel protein n=1 Tax=Pontibacillus yanchengensis TaxID=462910 RepID=A0ACC7VI70_9BACI|nr:TIM barrel protein [Pontibacillus yanchengensis]MYL54483.1 TIM barrel protein [Pontibacillus yanchengensis]